MTITIRPADWLTSIYEIILNHINNPSYIDGIVIFVIALCLFNSLILKSKARFFQKVIAIFALSAMWPITFIIVILLTIFTLVNIIFQFIGIIDKDAYWWNIYS